MGLGGFKTSSNATYLRIGMGVDEKDRPRAVIAKRVKEGTPGAVQVFKGNGDPVLDKDNNPTYRLEFGDVSGKVFKIERVENEYNGKTIHSLNIHIVSDGEVFVLQLDKGDEYWGDFALRAPNVDWSREIRFVPYSIPREDNPDKRNRLLVMYQDGKKIERKWSKDSPDGPPQPYKDEDEGKWMWGKRNNWLDNGPIGEAIKLVGFMNNAEPVDAEREVPGEGMDLDDIM